MPFNLYFKPGSQFSSVLLPILFFPAFYTLFFSPVIFSERLLAPSDGLIYYVPAFYSPRVLWTNLILSGFPVAADPQVETWYPLSLFFSLIPNSWNVFFSSAYILASCFAYGYVYTLTGSTLAALVSGLVYGMSGFMMSHLTHTAMIHSALWIPLLIWTWEKLRDNLTAHWLIIGVCGVACNFLAGHPQMFVYGIGLSIFYIGVRGNSAPVGRWNYYKWCVLVLSLGIALAAIQIIPTLEFSHLTVRAKLTFSEFAGIALPVNQIIQLLFPYLFGYYFPDSFYNVPNYFGEANLSELTGYIGLLPILLAVIGFFSTTSKPLKWFWIGVSVFALLLSLGDATPLARIMYYVPAYNKFRAPTRHFMEMSLGVSVLAGLGVVGIQKQLVSNRLILKIVSVSTGVMLISLIGIFSFANQLKAQASEAGFRQLTLLPWSNRALAVPLVIFAIAVAILLIWGKWRTLKLIEPLLVLVLIIDLGSFGWFYIWQESSPHQNALQPTVVAQTYKERLNQNHQRILPIQGGYAGRDALAPNLSRLWGIPNSSGYGPLILSRISQVLGMNPAGQVQGNWGFQSNHSLDILSIRYVFIPKVSTLSDANGVSWSQDNLSLSLGSGCGVVQPNSVDFQVPDSIPATAIGIVSSLGCAAQIADNTEVLRIEVRDTNGKSMTQSLRAGRDTSEWAYDCTDVRPQMKHRKAPIFESFPVVRESFPSCQGHQYVSLLPLNSLNNVKRLSLKWISPVGSISLQKISVIDKTTNQSYPITELSNTARWHHVEDINQTMVYENLQAMPRAWLVPEVISAKPNQVLEAIQSSRLPDGRTYKPEQVALVEAPLRFKAQNPDVAATAEIISLSNSQIEIQTDSTSPAFLVLSDVYYPGWRATIDGKTTPIFQTNYVLRGVQVPAGKHRVTFEFNPVSFHIGLGVSSASLVLLAYLGWKLSRSQERLN